MKFQWQHRCVNPACGHVRKFRSEKAAMAVPSSGAGCVKCHRHAAIECVEVKAKK